MTKVNCSKQNFGQTNSDYSRYTQSILKSKCFKLDFEVTLRMYAVIFGKFLTTLGKYPVSQRTLVFTGLTKTTQRLRIAVFKSYTII